MRMSSNPTAASAVIGQDLDIAAGRGRWLALAKDLVFPAIMLAVAIYLIVGIVTMKVPEGASFPGPGFFPGIVAGALLLLTGFLVVRAVKADTAYRAAGSTQALQAIEAELTGEAPPRRVGVDFISIAWIVVSFVVFAFTLKFLGWILGAALLFVGVARGLGEKSWLRSLFVGLTVSSVSYIAFDMMLDLSLPSGIIGWRF